MARRHWVFFFPTKVTQLGQGADTWRANRGQWSPGSATVHTKVREAHNHLRAHLVRETRNIRSRSKQPSLRKRLPCCVHSHHPRGCAQWCAHHTAGHRLSARPISFSQAARAECLLTGRHGLCPAWRLLGEDNRGQTSFSGLSSPCLTAGQRQGGLPTPGGWGLIQVLMDAETAGRLKAAILLTGTPPGVWSEQTGLRSSRVVPSPLHKHQVLTQTLNGQPLLINLSGPSQSFSVQVPVP